MFQRLTLANENDSAAQHATRSVPAGARPHRGQLSGDHPGEERFAPRSCARGTCTWCFNNDNLTSAHCSLTSGPITIATYDPESTGTTASLEITPRKGRWHSKRPLFSPGAVPPPLPWLAATEASPRADVSGKEHWRESSGLVVSSSGLSLGPLFLAVPPPVNCRHGSESV